MDREELINLCLKLSKELGQSDTREMVENHSNLSIINYIYYMKKEKNKKEE